MSDEYYEAMRQAIFWHTMWTCVIPWSIIFGLLAGVVTWGSLRDKKQSRKR